LTDPAIRKKVEARYVAPIDEAELACRIVEAAGNMQRPVGMTAQQALTSMSPEDEGSAKRSARAAMEYWRECIADANRLS